MKEELRRESETLTRCWMQHEATWLRDYLVNGVEDPRINVQSILSRHFLARALFGNIFEELMEQEVRFAAVMNWLAEATGPDVRQGVLHALRQRADNAEGLSIPYFVSRAFALLSETSKAHKVSNYIESFLAAQVHSGTGHEPREPIFDTFQNLWITELVAAPQISVPNTAPISLLEPGCGSANDYRFIESYGMARFLDYTGFDLCPKNVANARGLFPDARFEVGNVFEIYAPNQSFELCLVHDLFEHLSLEGLEASIREICRVTRRALCIGFFQMDEIDE